MRDYNVQNVLAFIVQNQKSIEGIDVYDIRGTATRWVDVNNLDDGKFVDPLTGKAGMLEGSHLERRVIKPDPTSITHNLFITNYEVVTNTNAMGEYQRVCFSPTPGGFYRVLFVETVTPLEAGAEPFQRLAVDTDWMNRPAA